MPKDHIWCKEIKLIKHKRLELQVGLFAERTSIFDTRLNWDKKQSHAGIMFWFEIFGVHTVIGITDERHWDHDNNKWEDA